MSDRTMNFGIKITADGRLASDAAAQVEKDVARIGTAAQQANRSVEASAKQAAFAMRMLPAQMTDIAVGLSSGQSPFTVLMQQGGQLKDMFGGIGPAAAAVGAYVRGMINPFTLTAAAAVGLGYALVKAFDDPQEPAKDLKTAVGDLAAAIDGVGKASRTFSMDKVYEEFNKANTAARQGIIEHLRYQKAMIDTQAAMAQQSLSKTLGGIGDYGFGDKMMGAFAGSAGEKLSKELGVSLNLANELLPAIKGLRNGTEDAGNFMARFGTELAKSSKGDAQQLLKDIKAVADGGNDAAAAQSRLSEALQKMQAAGSNGMIDIEGKAKKARAEVDELAAVLNKIFSKDAGLDASYWKDLETLNKAYVSGRLGVDAYRDAVGKLTTAQKFHQDGLRDDAAEMKLWADAAARATQEAEKQLQSLEAKALAMEDEVRYYGKTTGEIQRTIIARLEERRAVDAGIDGNEASVEALDREIEARKRLAAAMDSKDALDANRRGLEEQQRDAQRAYEQMSQSLTDEIMRGGKSGLDLLESYARTVVLRPIIQGVVNSGLSALGMGPASGSSGGSSPLSFGNGNIAGTVANMIVDNTSFSAATNQAILHAGDFLGTAMPYIAAAAAVISMFSKESTPHTGGIAFGSASGISTPVGRDAIGGFYADPAQALGLGMMRSDWTSRNDAAMSAQLGTVAKGFADTLDNILKANNLGSGYQVGLAFSADGEDPARGHATITDARGNIIGSYKDKNDLGKDASAAMQKLVGTEMPQMLLAALEGMDLNNLADSFLDSLNIEGLGADAATQALTFVDASDEIIAAFEKVGFSASDVTYDLIQAMGGFDAAGSAINAMAQQLDAIAQAAARSSAMFEDGIRSIQLSALDDPGKYDFLDQEAQRYRDVLATLTDRDLISQYSEKLYNSTMQAFNLLDADQQRLKSPEFIAKLQSEADLTAARYAVSRDDAAENIKLIAAAVKEAIAESTASSVTASNAVTAAVERGFDVRVKIDMDDLASSEVGGWDSRGGGG